MNESADINIGIIGLGNMGSVHATHLQEGQVHGARLAAVCDRSAERVTQFTSGDFDGVTGFDDPMAMIQSDQIDAVMVVVPHFMHPDLVKASFAAGKHVLCEKPLAVTASSAQEMLDAAASHPELKFAGMFQQRLQPIYQQTHRMIQEGPLAHIIPARSTITDWYRTQTYYNSGGWRATWAGEGGGVLLNQCPHNLDLFCWFVGLPDRVQAITRLGGMHDIEVEDHVAAILSFPNGAIGTLTTSTGEYPGVNRLELVGDRGTIIIDGGKLSYTQNVQRLNEYTPTSEASFVGPALTRHQIDAGGTDPGHKGVTQNFVDAIRGRAELLTPGAEGILGLELGNAILLAGLTRSMVELPLDRAAYDQQLDALITTSRFDPDAATSTQPKPKSDMSKSFK